MAQSACMTLRLPTLAAVAAIGFFSLAGPRAASAAPAVFHNPGGIAAGPSNTLYVANQGSHTVTVLSPSGAVRATWHIALRDRRLDFYPTELSVSPGGTVYALSSGSGNSGGIVKLSPGGRILARWGGGKLANPLSIAAAPNGLIYVLYQDAKKNSSAPAGSYTARVEVLTARGRIVRSWRTDAPGLQGVYPDRIAVDRHGSVYLSLLATNDCPSLHEDCRQHFTLVDRFSPTGKRLVTWHTATRPALYADSLTVDAQGQIFLGGVGTIVKLSPMFRILGTWSVSGCGAAGLGPVTGLAVDQRGSVYATTSHGPDPYGTLQKFTSSGRLIATWGNCA
jgi:DNA-binding beta-propeller fold protein YncE